MLSKQEHVQFWIQQADSDWETVEILFAAKKFAHGLFWAHLVCEKLAKALWIVHNEDNFPPRIHNIYTILTKTPILITDELKEYIMDANRFQMEERYPEYINTIEEVYEDEALAVDYLERIQKLRLWLKKNLQ